MLRFHTRCIAQYLEYALQVTASFIVTQFIFTAYEKKTSERVDAAGDRLHGNYSNTIFYCD